MLSAYLFTQPSVITGHPVVTTKGRDNQLKAHRDKISESARGRGGTVTHYRQGTERYDWLRHWKKATFGENLRTIRLSDRNWLIVSLTANNTCRTVRWIILQCENGELKNDPWWQSALSEVKYFQCLVSSSQPETAPRPQTDSDNWEQVYFLTLCCPAPPARQRWEELENKIMCSCVLNQNNAF